MMSRKGIGNSFSRLQSNFKTTLSVLIEDGGGFWANSVNNASKPTSNKPTWPHHMQMKSFHFEQIQPLFLFSDLIRKQTDGLENRY